MILDTFIFNKTITIFTFKLEVPSVRLSTRFDNEVAINFAIDFML